MIINANALNIPLADKSVQMIVTSPPYWGLRDYGTATWIGGDTGCNHIASQKKDLSSGLRNDGREHKGLYEGEKATEITQYYRNTCGKCGAIRVDNQLGLERTPEEYISNMVAVFRECWRVLRDDGTCWVNVGDSYAQNGGKRRSEENIQYYKDKEQEYINNGSKYNMPSSWDERGDRATNTAVSGLKPKDLVGIPWRLAFALQADGWYLRSDIIWNKPNPMPESVTDRPTKSHEYLFLLTKRANYYYDAEAIREDSDSDSGWSRERKNGKNTWEYNMTEERIKATGQSKPGVPTENGHRNRRSVWTIPTAPYKGAHFATFPPALVEPCIKAGTSERGACPKCGKGWRRMVDIKQVKLDNKETSGRITGGTSLDSGAGNKNGGFHELPRTRKESNTLGWQPACNCNAGDPIPCLVFDPFVGSGTTVKVAYDLGRRGVGLDLSLEYLDEQARKRIHNGHVDRLF